MKVIQSTICLHRVSSSPRDYLISRVDDGLQANPMMLHRSDFLRALRTEVPSPPFCTIHTSKRLTSLTRDSPDGTVQLHFSDGTTSTADVVVGADGIRSVVRASMLSEEDRIEPQWPGVVAYRAMVPSEVLDAHGIGEDHHIRKLAHIVRVYLTSSAAC